MDEELAGGIKMATGAAALATAPHDNRPEILDALSRPLPRDPNEFKKLWDQLTPEEKRWLFNHDHSIGTHDGMPFEERDGYNRIYLGDLQRANQAELDRLRELHPDWADGKQAMFGSPEWPTAPDWPTWKQQWDDVNRARLGYQQVQQALQSPDGSPRFLATIDNEGRAAVSINNPDTAKRNVTFVPGTGQDLTRLQFSTIKSHQMLESALRMDPSLRPRDVSVTTWMGYDRPMDIIPQAASTSYAHNGAKALDNFQAGMRVSHNDFATAGPSINTVIGHSYGSTLLGAAGLDGHHLDANNVVAVGSPGVLAQRVSDLSLAPGSHFFATRAENDIIGIATYTSLGPDPMASSFGGIPFEATPGPSGLFDSPTVDAHSSYWDVGNPALINMGLIIDGRLDVTPPTFTP